jgi:hypothetical protein
LVYSISLPSILYLDYFGKIASLKLAAKVTTRFIIYKIIPDGCYPLKCPGHPSNILGVAGGGERELIVFPGRRNRAPILESAGSKARRL